MDKLDLAQRLARKAHRSRGQAADDVDTLVYQMLKDLKRAQRRAGVTREEQTSTAPAAIREKK